jgi:Lrp/AsnC family transcriptional regulator, leucine-responsive regulatory protein
MKNIAPKLIQVFQKGYCTPQISRIAKAVKEPSTTIHYNIKKLEKEGVVKAYKAVLNYSAIEQGYCVFVLLSLLPEEYADPEKIGRALASHPAIESVDICTGNWEMIVKVRVRDQDEYYELVKTVISRKGVGKIVSLTSLKQLKSEFIEG